MINAPVLVLNQNYEPLNVCDIRRAFRLLGADKAELLERNHQMIHTPTIAIRAPSVIRLVYINPGRQQFGSRTLMPQETGPTETGPHAATSTGQKK